MQKLIVGLLPPLTGLLCLVACGGSVSVNSQAGGAAGAASSWPSYGGSSSASGGTAGVTAPSAGGLGVATAGNGASSGETSGLPEGVGGVGGSRPGSGVAGQPMCLPDTCGQDFHNVGCPAGFGRDEEGKPCSDIGNVCMYCAPTGLPCFQPPIPVAMTCCSFGWNAGGCPIDPGGFAGEAGSGGMGGMAAVGVAGESGSTGNAGSP